MSSDLTGVTVKIKDGEKEAEEFTNRDEEVKEQQEPKEKRGRAKANSTVKWWDQATWTKKEWKAYNKRNEELRALDEIVKRTNAKARVNIQVPFDVLWKQIKKATARSTEKA